MSGPYESNAEATADARHVYEANRNHSYRPGELVALSPVHSVPAVPMMDRINAGLTLAALKSAGVELGAYDRRIAGWLATWEPELVQVVIGWIERAHAAGRDAERCVPRVTTPAVALAAVDRLAAEQSRPRCRHCGRVPVHAVQTGHDGQHRLIACAPSCNADRLAEHAQADACGRCGQPFDPADKRFDGRARQGDTPWCHGCVDRCHDCEDAFHICVICRTGDNAAGGAS